MNLRWKSGLRDSSVRYLTKFWNKKFQLESRKLDAIGAEVLINGLKAFG